MSDAADNAFSHLVVIGSSAGGAEAVSRVLSHTRNLDEAAPEILRIIGEHLGWEAGVFWTVDDGSLRCARTWSAASAPPGSLAQQCQGARFARGEGLPGRVWTRGEALWVEDALEGEDPLLRVLAGEGLRGAIAFPVQDGDILGVFEFFRREVLSLDEQLLQTASIIGGQIGQFVERRRAEEERDRYLLRERRARREAIDILESMNDAFFALDRDWCLTYVNQKAEQFWSRTRTDLLRKNLWEEFPEVAESEISREIRHAMENGATTSFETIWPVIGVWVAGRAYPSSGGVSVYLQDITDRKQAERELLTLKDDMDAELSAMSGLHHLSTRLLAASELHTVLEEVLDASIELQGADLGNIQLYDRETGTLEIVAHRGFDQEFLDYFSDTDENAACGRAMKQGERVVIEDVEKDARFGPHRRIAAFAGFRAVQSTPLFDRTGELLGMLSTHFRQPHRSSERELRMTDLYARQAAEIIGAKLAEERLRENEEWLQLAARAARSGTWEWDLASGEIRWSDEHRELFGIASEKPVTREKWFAMVHPDDLPAIEEAGLRCSEEGEEWPEVIEYRIRRGGETRWICAWGKTVRNDSGHPVRILGISVDVTDHKKAEEERERLIAQELAARAQAEERRRLSRELHDRVAHDIALVHQSLELHQALKEHDPEKSAAKLELARKSTREALESTRNLSMELRRLEVSRGLESALSDLLRDVIPPGASFEVSAEGDEAPVPAEVRTQVLLILREAIRNAVTHSDCSRIKVRLQVLPEAMVCSVEDDGQGFHTHDLHPADHNGLKSMEERASLLGGTLGVSSTPGRGTTIQVTVPLGERDGE